MKISALLTSMGISIATVSVSCALHAQSIGLNFVGGNADASDTTTPALLAGLVPQTNWNNLTGSNTGQRHRGTNTRR